MTKKKLVFLHDIARILESYLNKFPGSYVHWVSVVDEPDFERVAKREWAFGDSLLQVAVAQGNNEGSFIYVHVQTDPCKTDSLVSLFHIKVLCDLKRAFTDASLVWEFFESKQFVEITGQA